MVSFNLVNNQKSYMPNPNSDVQSGPKESPDIALLNGIRTLFEENDPQYEGDNWKTTIPYTLQDGSTVEAILIYSRSSYDRKFDGPDWVTVQVNAPGLFLEISIGYGERSMMVNKESFELDMDIVEKIALAVNEERHKRATEKAQKVAVRREQLSKKAKAVF